MNPEVILDIHAIIDNLDIRTDILMEKSDEFSILKLKILKKSFNLIKILIDAEDLYKQISTLIVIDKLLFKLEKSLGI